MEAEAAVRIWGRSEQHGFRYATFVGDGDSTAYKAVCAMEEGRGPYDKKVVKEECINHVGKRMGTRLRELQKENVIVKETKTGKRFKRSVLGGSNMLTMRMGKMGLKEVKVGGGRWR